MASEQEEVEVGFISALDDADIRLQCFRLVQPHGTDFEETLVNAKVLYTWVMGEDDTTLEEAADPASVTPEDSCEPQRH